MPERVDRLRRPALEQPDDRQQPSVVHDVAEHGHPVLGRGPLGLSAAVRRVPAALGQVAVVFHVPAGQRRLCRGETGQVVGQPDRQGVRWLRIRLRVSRPRPDCQQRRRRPTAHGLPAAEKRQKPHETPRPPPAPPPPPPPPQPPSRQQQQQQHQQQRRPPSPAPAQRRRTDPASDQVHGGSALAAAAVPDRGRRGVFGQLRVPGRLFVVRRRRRLLRVLRQDRQGQSDGLSEVRDRRTPTATAARGNEALTR